MDKDLIPVTEAVERLPPAALAQPALKRPSGKKGKIFADKSHMLKLIEDIGDRENERIQLKRERDSEKLKIMEAREAVAARKKETKQERLKRIKEALRKKQEREEADEDPDNKHGKNGKHGKNNKDSKKDNKNNKKDFNKSVSVKKPTGKSGKDNGKGRKVSFKE